MTREFQEYEFCTQHYNLLDADEDEAEEMIGKIAQLFDELDGGGSAGQDGGPVVEEVANPAGCDAMILG